ncbi:hypothetical protein ACVEKC_004027, partial [Escherichia coli]
LLKCQVHRKVSAITRKKSRIDAAMVGLDILRNEQASCNQVNHLIPTRVLVKGGEITCKILK